MRADPGSGFKKFGFHLGFYNLLSMKKVPVEVVECYTDMMKSQTLVSCFDMAVVKESVRYEVQTFIFSLLKNCRDH